MKIIKGNARHQMQFSSLDELVAGNNPVRIPDAFVEKPDVVKTGIEHSGKKQQTRPGGAPMVYLFFV